MNLRELPRTYTRSHIPKKALWFCLLGALVLSGCNIFRTPVPHTPLPTGYIQTAIALTVLASGQNQYTTPSSTFSPTASSTTTPSPTQQIETTPLPSETSTPTSTPTMEESEFLIGLPVTTPLSPDQIPYATIQILKPGPLSKVTYPISVRIYVIPGEGGRVRLELLGEDGRSLARKLLVTQSEPGKQVYIDTEIPFEISATAEIALLQVSIDDAYGRLIALNSVKIILLSIGDAEINPTTDLREPIIIQQPTEFALIQGGIVQVTGTVLQQDNQSLSVQLITTSNKLVGNRRVYILPEDTGEYDGFSAEVPYSVSEPTWARLTVISQISRPPSTIYLASLEVLLSP
ncbi:MAG: hypothetical protein AB1345_00550 [Chloroflexota bacterium]